MKNVFVSSDNILSPIGLTSAENFAQLKKLVSGIEKHEDETISEQPFYASLFGKEIPFLSDDFHNKYTKFEKLLIASITNALKGSGIDAGDMQTALILSSTKGNISLVETEEFSQSLSKRIALSTSAKLVADYFQFTNQPIIVSHACISGLLAIITGMRMIRSGKYENVVIAGADVISKFVLSGFQSFQAISGEHCKPFDQSRNGINLGEGAGTIILTSNKKFAKGIKLSGGSISNDSNHISGPSRTGEELGHSIKIAIKDAFLSNAEIDFISAHGTATVYNDEMEAKAITLVNLQDVPINSLKGYYGHTLGAAGLIESIISTYSLNENIILPTKGFQRIGVTQPINICNSLYKTPLRNCLKIASGFGGCNAAVVFSKQ